MFCDADERLSLTFSLSTYVTLPSYSLLCLSHFRPYVAMSNLPSPSALSFSFPLLSIAIKNDQQQYPPTDNRQKTTVNKQNKSSYL